MEINDERLAPPQSKATALAQIILPCSQQYISATAEQLAERMKMHDYFSHGKNVVHVVIEERISTLDPICAQLLRSESERFGELVRWSKVKDGDMEYAKLLPSRMRSDDAQALLVAIHQRLPKIRALVNFPPLRADGSVQRARYDSETGLFCTGPFEVADVSVAEAKALLGCEGLLRDFQFQSKADASRLLAAMLSPGLRFGPWAQATAPFPLNLTEADKSQSGKGFASEMIASLYGEHMSNISQQGKGGVGSFDEKIQSELLKGRPMVCLDNLRGTVDCKMIESFMTARGAFSLRAFFREGSTDSRSHVLFATSNGIQMTEDLANRALVVRIRKQPQGYRWHRWPDGGVTGDLLLHLAANRAQYLGAIYAVLRRWIKAGMPINRTEHAFRDSVGALDWMVTMVFGCPSLTDGHDEIQQRQSSPILGFLREFGEAAGEGEYYASDFLEGAEEYGLSLPESVAKRMDVGGPPQALGRLLSRAFKEGEGISVDAWSIDRIIKPRGDGGGGGNSKTYRFTRILERSPREEWNAPGEAAL